MNAAANRLNRMGLTGINRIFVYCPAKLRTGGAELLHQLVFELRQLKLEAFLVYYPFIQEAAGTDPDYLKYGCPVVSEVPDARNVAVVVPEVFTHLLSRFKHAKHVIWWLSVDHYRGGFGTQAGWKVILRRLVFSDIPRPKETLHLFQSVYAQRYVRRNFGVEGHMLGDYISSRYFADVAEGQRSRFVVYNPSKGYRFTRKIIDENPGVEFRPLFNMTQAEVIACLDQASAYIDFGYHPGKDRIPREAALRGAVVIVGTRGAAMNEEDVPLPPCYKLPFSSEGRRLAKQLIQDVFNRYDYHYSAQASYRLKINKEYAVFLQQIRNIFSV